MGADADARLRAYARLAVEIGINLQPGQRLAINALVEHHPFVRAVAEAAYEAGASYVDVQVPSRPAAQVADPATTDLQPGGSLSNAPRGAATVSTVLNPALVAPSSYTSG